MLSARRAQDQRVHDLEPGVSDYLPRPLGPGELVARARAIVPRTAVAACDGPEVLQVGELDDRLGAAASRLEGSSEIVGSSPAIRELREKIARVAPINVTVLITGETGTGKELVARALHRSGNRASRPLVAINCAAFTDTLLESELFGHERGAFTGADRAREGLFETAHEGTLFLDEAGELSMAAQAKLLRVLTDGLVTRVGSTRPRQVDVRLIVATHRDLRQRARDGLFRDDLYYRLAVVPLLVPPLRERKDDIPALCELLLARAARDHKARLRGISAEALGTLVNYDFPGNIRELKNLLERACVFSAGDEILPENFPMMAPRAVKPRAGADGAGELSPKEFAELMPEILDLRKFLASVEKAVIQRVLRAAGGTQAEAARRLGLSRSHVSYKLGKHNIKARSALE
jgi:transcriptional regulator with GAF, ATPase, and Fis domain